MKGLLLLLFLPLTGCLEVQPEPIDPEHTFAAMPFVYDCEHRRLMYPDRTNSDCKADESRPADTLHRGDGFYCIAESVQFHVAFWLLQDPSGRLSVEWWLHEPNPTSQLPMLISLNAGHGNTRQEGFIWTNEAGSWDLDGTFPAGDLWFRMDGYQFRPEDLHKLNKTIDDMSLRVTSFLGSLWVLWVIQDVKEAYLRTYAELTPKPTPYGTAYRPSSYNIHMIDEEGKDFWVPLYVRALHVNPILRHITIPEPHEPALLDESPCDQWPGNEALPLPPDARSTFAEVA